MQPALVRSATFAVAILLAAAPCFFAIKTRPRSGQPEPINLVESPSIIGCGARDDRAGSWVTSFLSRFITFGYEWSGFVISQDDGHLKMAEEVEGLLGFLGAHRGLWRAREFASCGVKSTSGECHPYLDKACYSMEAVFPVSLEAQYYLAALYRIHGGGKPPVNNGKINVAMHYRAGDVRGASDGHFLPIREYYVEQYNRLKNHFGDQLGTCDFFAEDFLPDEERDAKKFMLDCKIREGAPIPEVWGSMINAEVIVIGRSQFQYVPAMFNCGIVLGPDYNPNQYHQGFDNYGLHKEPKWLLGVAAPLPGADAIRQQVAKCHEVGNSYMQKDLQQKWPFGPNAKADDS